MVSEKDIGSKVRWDMDHTQDVPHAQADDTGVLTNIDGEMAFVVWGKGKRVVRSEWVNRIEVQTSDEGG